MADETQALEVVAGDTLPITLTIEDSVGRVVDISSYVTTMIQFKLYNGTTLLVTKSIGSGIAITDGDAGIATITLAAADTANLSGAYSWVATITPIVGALYTVASGILYVPGKEPVTLAEVKSYMKVDTNYDDSLIIHLIIACTKLAEEYTRRKFVTQTLEASFDYDELFEYGEFIELIGPVASITSIKSYDDEDVESTMTPTYYRISGDRVVLAAGKEWPSDLRDRDCIVVRYVAGYGVASYVPEGIKTGIKAMVLAAYENRCTVPDLNAGKIYLDQYKVYSL